LYDKITLLIEQNRKGLVLTGAVLVDGEGAIGTLSVPLKRA
jgi:hypothetical protein